MSTIRGVEVEFISHGVTMGGELIDPEERNMRECKKCGTSKYPSAFTPSQLKLKSPQCRSCRAVTEKKRKVGGVLCDYPLGTFLPWDHERRLD
jgi:hypothetical protein